MLASVLFHLSVFQMVGLMPISMATVGRRGEEVGPGWTTNNTRGSGDVGEYWAQGSGLVGAVRIKRGFPYIIYTVCNTGII